MMHFRNSEKLKTLAIGEVRTCVANQNNETLANVTIKHTVGIGISYRAIGSGVIRREGGGFMGSGVR